MIAIARDMLFVMRAAVLATACACNFTPGMRSVDSGATAPDLRAPDDLNITWAVDPTSDKGVPSTASEWSDLAAAHELSVTPPDHLWLLQESTGNVLDSIGLVPLVPVNVPTYGEAIPGWTRLGVGTRDTMSDQGFADTTMIGNLNGTSHLLLAYVAVFSPPVAERSLLGIGRGNDHRYVAVTPTPAFKGSGIGVANPTTGAMDPMAVVHPLVIAINSTASTHVVYTDSEKLDVPWQGTTGIGNLVVLGNASIGAANARYLYAAMWSGPKAELSDATMRHLLESLGWTVSGF